MKVPNAIAAGLLAGAVTFLTQTPAQPRELPRPFTACTMETTMISEMRETKPATECYVGMWVTADGHVRHELLPNGRYDEARGNRQSAYQGRYTITGNHIDYVDDTGFTADGEFVDGVLYHGGMVLRRQQRP